MCLCLGTNGSSFTLATFPHVADGSLVGLCRYRTCPEWLERPGRCLLGCKVQGYTDLHVKIRGDVNTRFQLDRSRGYILEAGFGKDRLCRRNGIWTSCIGVDGYFQARSFSWALTSWIELPTQHFFFSPRYPKDIPKPVDPKPISIFLLLNLPYSPCGERHYHLPGVEKGKRRSRKSR